MPRVWENSREIFKEIQTEAFLKIAQMKTD
jgi:hypothetical protein